MNEKPNYRFSICRLIATLGVSFLIIGAIIAGGGAGFINIPAAMMTFGVCSFLLLGSFGTDFLKFIPASFACLAFSPSRPNARYAEIAKTGSRYVIGAGVIGALIGCIQMLRNLEDPSMIGLGMSVAFLVPFYSLLASEIFFAFVHKAFSDCRSNKEGESLPISNVVTPLIVIGFLMGTFFIMLIAFGNVQQEALIQQYLMQNERIQE